MPNLNNPRLSAKVARPLSMALRRKCFDSKDLQRFLSATQNVALRDKSFNGNDLEKF
jgi:hypothetical protein